MTEIVDTYTYAAILDFGLTEHFSFILRYGVASYGIDQDALNRTIATAERIGIHLPPLNLSDTVSIHVGTLGYKYRFNPHNKMNPFVEMGLGLSNPMPVLDTGTKLTASAALGFQHTLSKDMEPIHRKPSLGMETTGYTRSMGYIGCRQNSHYRFQ